MRLDLRIADLSIHGIEQRALKPLFRGKEINRSVVLLTEVGS